MRMSIGALFQLFGTQDNVNGLSRGAVCRESGFAFGNAGAAGAAKNQRQRHQQPNSTKQHAGRILTTATNATARAFLKGPVQTGKPRHIGAVKTSATLVGQYRQTRFKAP